MRLHGPPTRASFKSCVSVPEQWVGSMEHACCLMSTDGRPEEGTFTHPLVN